LVKPWWYCAGRLVVELSGWVELEDVIEGERFEGHEYVGEVALEKWKAGEVLRRLTSCRERFKCFVTWMHPLHAWDECE